MKADTRSTPNPLQGDTRESNQANTGPRDIKSFSIEEINRDEIVVPKFCTWTNSFFIMLSFIFQYVVAVGMGAAGFIIYTGYFQLSFFSYVIVGLVGYIVQTYVSIAVGYYCDKIKTSIGRRKPLIIAGFIFQAIGMMLVGLPPNKEQNTLFGWYFFCYICYVIGATVYGIPFSAWMVESTADDKEYRFISTILYPIAAVIGFAGTIYFGLSLKVGSLLSPIFFGILFLVGGGVTVFGLVTIVPNPANKKVDSQPPLIPSVRTCLRTPEFKTLFTNEILIQSAVGIGQSMVQYYVLIGFPDVISKYSDFEVFVVIVTIAATLGGAFATIITNFILAHFDKVRVYFGIIFLVAFFGVMLFIGCISITYPLFLLCTIMYGILSYPLIAIDGLLLRDLIVLDTLTTGLQRASTYSTAMSIPTSLIARVIISIPTIIVLGSGLQQKADPSDDLITAEFSWNSAVKNELMYFASFILTLLALISFFVMRNYPVNDKLAAEINTLTQKRLAAMDAESSSGPLSIADNKDEMLMLHFSDFEIDSMMLEPRFTIKAIYMQSIIGLVLACISMALILFGIAVQLEVGNSSFVQILIIFLLFISMYIFYETLRYQPLRALRYVDEAVVRSKAMAAKRRNNKVNSNLFDIIERERARKVASVVTEGMEDEAQTSASAVAADQSEEGNGESDGEKPKTSEVRELARDTMRDSLSLADMEFRGLSGLPGYKRIYSLLLLLIGVGILAILV